MPLITFEGIDGCGKSTAVKRIADILESMYVPYYVTTEPYKYRDLIFSGSKAPLEELALWLADRNAHINEVIKPVLAKNPYTVILCDRYTDSTCAYQTTSTGLSLEYLKNLNYLFVEGKYLPTRTYFLKVDIKTAMKRVTKSNKYDNQSYAWYYNIETNYLNTFADRSDVVQIDANQSIDDVVRDIFTDLQRYLHNVSNHAK